LSHTITMLRSCVSLLAQVSPVSQVMRGMSRRAPGNNRVYKPLMLELNKRREVVELDNRLKNKDSVARRSSYSDWNYPAELKALQARLGEQIDSDLLSRSMIMNSHLELERKKQEELGVEVSEQMVDNSLLADRGREVMQRTLTRWLRGAFSRLPEEMISELRDFLMTDEILADVAFHIGLREIILSEEYPPLAATLRKCLEALVGALDSSQPDRAAQLVIDIIASQLHGKEVQEICTKSLSNPMNVLKKILTNSGMEPPEPRLLFQTGPDTILASHLVGLYCHKEIIGQSYGETLEIAEEMAARDALRNILGTAEHSQSPPWGREPGPGAGDKPNTNMESLTVEPRNIINC